MNLADGKVEFNITAFENSLTVNQDLLCNDRAVITQDANVIILSNLTYSNNSDATLGDTLNITITANEDV